MKIGMARYKDLVYINTKWKKLMSTIATTRHDLNYCYIPRCKVCNRILNNEYVVRNRTRYKRPLLTCLNCYHKISDSLPKKVTPKYNPYKIAYEGVLLWEQLIR
jgi:hypothetical protein